MNKFRPGIGMMAVRLQVPVIPVRLDGLFEVYSIHHDWPKAGPVRVTFGRPMRFSAKTPFVDAAGEIEDAVIRLSSA
jgi:1-acyl-sn-glycerol-3-phosphate acyltransferase